MLAILWNMNLYTKIQINNNTMHEDDLKDAIFTSIFDDEDTYRKMYVPTVHHIRKNPNNKDRIKELVDNATMKFCKNQNMSYTQISDDVKKGVAIALYNEMIDHENPGSNRE